ncbi:spindle pole body component 110 [Eurytemora carolleeae]|uniref:spindle pole body component 110 n=1 Tax=Eurytemora carolleeae TaxID=1294199 RepID=UPI000C768C7E|nr:spindle pole body component 110 [Eurytemora carolleeae]|eukprot:XP_023326133.1 spindle pole body component 110-like [Eurytemora affinis]
MKAENAKMELAHKNNALIKAETDVKISKKLVKKYEEVSGSLQEKLLQLTRDKAELQVQARRTAESLEAAQAELEAAKQEADVQSKLAKQRKMAGRIAERERGEDSILLNKLQIKVREMRLSMGRRIEELEKELDKKDIKFQDYKSRTDTSIRNTRKELEVQERMVEKLIEERRRLKQEREDS